MQATRECSRLSAYTGKMVQYKSSPLSALCRCVILILLSASWSAEARQCYWCGPLSEQVHRSRRVQPCGDSLATTACDPGYDHCAVIASAPNYVESRLCVKLYQDECYPTYCNTSKVWRMTCPCRKDLCNGPNTERETEAFNALKKLAAKTQSRIKKRSTKVDTDELMVNIGNNDISYRKNHNNGEDTSSIEEQVPAMDKQETSIKMENTTNATTCNKNENIVTEITTGKIDLSQNEVKLDQMQSDQPNPNHDDSAAKLKVNQIESDNLGKGMANKKEPGNATDVNGEPQLPHDIENQGTATMKVVTEKNLDHQTKVKTTPKMPAPLVNTESISTVQTTTISSETNNTKEHAGPNSKNSAVGICLHGFLLFKWLVLHYYS